MRSFLVKVMGRHFFACAFVFLFSLRLIYMFSIQPGNAPDEVGHMVMVVGFAQGRYINLQESMHLTFYPYPIYNPLGYLPSSFFLRFFSLFNKDILELSDPFLFTPLQNYVARLGMQVWTVGFLLLFLRLIRGVDQKVRVALVCGVALLPQLIFVQSYVNLDSVGLAVFLYLFWAIQEKREGHLALGSFLLTCCKMNFFCLFVLPLGYLLFRYGTHRRAFVKKAIELFVFPVMLGSFWFVFSYFVNTLQHGAFLGFNALTAIYPHADKGGFRVFSLDFINISLDSVFGQFGWMKFRYPELIYSLWRILILPLGFYSLWMSVSSFSWREKKKVVSTTAFSLVVLNLVIHFWASFTNNYQPQGRYILPAIMVLQTYLVLFLTREPLTPKRRLGLRLFCLLMFFSAIFGSLVSSKKITNSPGLRLSGS